MDFAAVDAIFWLFLSLGFPFLNVALAGKRGGVFLSCFLGGGIYLNPTESRLCKETLLAQGALRASELVAGMSREKTLR